MRRVIALLVLTVAISQAQPASAQARGVEELPVTIQIRDYAHVPAQSIARASRIVSDLYARIGVRIEWLGVVSRGDRRGGSDNRDEASRGRIRQMTILLLTPTMAARGHVGENVLGFVAVANEGMGRIAYVVFDRLRDTARHATTTPNGSIAAAIAHGSTAHDRQILRRRPIRISGSAPQDPRARANYSVMTHAPPNL